MTHVYLSYFFKDKAFTDRLVADLRAAGIAYIDFTRDEAAGFAKLDRELRRRGL